MLVKDIMSTRLIMVKPEDTARNAVKRMVENRISGMIVEAQGKAVGMVTMRDVCRGAVAEGKDVGETIVRDLMSQPVLSVHPLNNIMKATELMAKHRIKRLAVVDKYNRVVGIITTMDIVSHLPELVEVMFKTWVKPQWR
jgi:CBS domain-containing protein